MAGPRRIAERSRALLALTVMATLAALGLAVAAAAPGPLAESIDRRSERWVEKTLEGLSLEDKAAQMIVVQVTGRHHHPEDAGFRQTLAQVRDLGVGGVIVSTSEVHAIPALLTALDAVAAVPLIVASDLERSLAFRVAEGVVPAPFAMAVGATRSADAARFLGEVTAREGRAVGIHWTFAPVADVNSNPANPVINLRAFGEDPDLVARLSAAFIEGARAHGMLTTAKHFPGHGDTAIDSHLGLPTVMADRARLERLELAPFRAAIAAGVDSIMVAHVAMPAIDPSGTPATLSPLLTEQLLRRDMGFGGLIVTDAMDMKGVAGVWVGAAAVRAVAAGADVVLMPPDVRVAHQSIVRAVHEGVLDEARIDQSVRRILEAKARLGLDRSRRPAIVVDLEQVARPADVAHAHDIAAAAVTVVRNHGGVLPLKAEARLDILHLVVASTPRHGVSGDDISAALAARGIGHTTLVLGSEVSEQTRASVLAAARPASHVLVSAYAVVPRIAGQPTLQPSVGGLLDALAAEATPLIVVSYASPYLLVEHPAVPVYVDTFGWNAASEAAAVAAIFGEHGVSGSLPVSLPGLYDRGHGIELPRRPLELAPPAEGAADPRFAAVDRLLDGYVEAGAFPGAVLAVGHRGRLVHLGAHGRQTYDPESPAVTADTLYDLASLTKVIATTTMAMILVDEGRLHLDAPVADYLPRFAGAGKAAVTVRHLLTHSSGVDWWAPLYTELRGKAAYLTRIQAMELAYEPGTKTLYSDLGLILLGEILERVAGKPLEDFVRARVLDPIGMTDTMFRPDRDLLPRIAPTEDDPAWRRRMLHGEVHDENAFALGGVAPHAGLFGTAPDLARFAQMILWGGVYDHQRIVSRPTVEAFTRPAEVVPGSTRALGWDTKSAEGSSAGTLFSPRSFGHTGFTGTSIWIDPQRQLFVILLANRVHPTRQNQQIRLVRPAVADAVVRALEGGAPDLDRRLP